MSERDDFGSFVSGFLFGGMVGAVVALLMAPQSGEETRGYIRDKSIEFRDMTVAQAEEAYHRAELAAGEARVRAEQLAEEARVRADELRRQGQVVLEEQRARLEGVMEAARAPKGASVESDSEKKPAAKKSSNKS
jgi:gas vesicle protein